jgi:hypothetical protein
MKLNMLDGPPSAIGTLIDQVQLMAMGLVAFLAAAVLVCGAYFAIAAIYRAITKAAKMIWGVLK